MDSVVNVLVHAIDLQVLEKVPHAKVENLRYFGQILMIQPSFNSSGVALQFEHGTCFFSSFRVTHSES